MSSILCGKLNTSDRPKLKGQFYKHFVQLVAIAEGETETAVVIKSDIYGLDQLKERFPYIEQMTYDDTVALGESIDPPREEETELGTDLRGFRVNLREDEKAKARIHSGVKVDTDLIDSELPELVNMIGGYLAIKFEGVESVEIKAKPNNIIMNISNAGQLLTSILSVVESKKTK